jgi:FixJ family two-component response regulator
MFKRDLTRIFGAHFWRAFLARIFGAHFWRAFLARIFGRIHNTRCMIPDMRMPGMNGLELRRRAAASHREATVIFNHGAW